MQGEGVGGLVERPFNVERPLRFLTNLASFQRLKFDKWSMLVQVKGLDVTVDVLIKKDGNFRVSVATPEEKRVLEVENNFTLADSVIDAKIDGKSCAVIQLVTFC